MKQFFLAILLVLSAPCFAKVDILDSALSLDISLRQPVGVLNPPSSCLPEHISPSTITIVDSSTHNKLFFWNKISSSDDISIIHKYYKDGISVRTERTEITLIDRVIKLAGEVIAGLGLKRIADVELEVKKNSHGWRTWSSKQIDPAVHVGDWMVKVVSSLEPENVICTTYFKVI